MQIGITAFGSGFNIGSEIDEIIILLDVLFILGVVASAASSNNWNLAEHGWNIISVFINTDTTKSLDNQYCAKALTGFAQEQTGAMASIRTLLTSSLGGVGGFVFSFVDLVVRLIAGVFGCGFSILRLLIGATIVLSLLYWLIKLVWMLRGSQ